MNSIWNKNLNAFTKRFSSLEQMFKPVINRISAEKKESLEDLNALFPFYNFSQAKNGEITAEEIFENQKKRLHSSYNPNREAQSAFTNQKKKSQLIFIGFGLGYHVVEASRQIKQNKLYNKLILIEENPVYFFASLCVLDWTEVFEIENLILAVGCPLDAITPLIETTNHINLGNEGLSDSHIFTLPVFTLHSKKYTENLLALIERNRTKNAINAATYKKFGKLWTVNSKKNLGQIKNCGFVNQIEKSTLPKDFLLIAAGPSLQNILPHLKILKEKMIIVCVETALHSLLKVGIQPDFIILTDPQYWAYRHIAGLEAKESILIAPLSVHPAVFRFKCKEILLCSDMFWISSFFEERLESFGDLGAGGSVAGSAWNLCYRLGAKQIYLAGLDLSFPLRQMHIKGSSAEQKFLTLNTRLHSLDKMSCSSIFSAKPEYGTTYEGKKVLTDSRMKMFAWWFESRIASCPEVKTYSLCKESLAIPGVTYTDVASGIKITSDSGKRASTSDKTSTPDRSSTPEGGRITVNKKSLQNFDDILVQFAEEEKNHINFPL